MSGKRDHQNLCYFIFIDQSNGLPLPQNGVDFTCPDQMGSNGQCVGTYPNYSIYGISNPSTTGAMVDLILSPLG